MTVETNGGASWLGCLERHATSWHPACDMQSVPTLMCVPVSGDTPLAGCTYLHMCTTHVVSDTFLAEVLRIHFVDALAG
jgi:hypothetical protein